MSDENLTGGLLDAAFSRKEKEEKDQVAEEEKATEGDIIAFKKGKQELEGLVVSAKLDNSVVVDMTIMENFEKLNLDYERTVVGHGKYTVKQRGTLPQEEE
ncbi:hypothetical protein N781_06010 [Pontibacillus halophilus JSM 076056 = DSM 19796]|uniref:DUF2187 domain-containing protein n=1 Tax=Pontibacillus halophilus JSM 076056 = DSM 19796 TaxID=1385510 RepID=A0A0A5GCK8_9BACI|nr:YkvS family protein [Pontibacillus halophilus]KGX90921.1 hypothetical protein N781_06010 [Pontibacillus halophilus JSM 076056 = DSM 19796]